MPKAEKSRGRCSEEQPVGAPEGSGREAGDVGGRRMCVGIVHRLKSPHSGLNGLGFHLQMDENGIYKAMGEFDIFINYIEEYLMMKRQK